MWQQEKRKYGRMKERASRESGESRVSPQDHGSSYVLRIFIHVSMYIYKQLEFVLHHKQDPLLSGVSGRKRRYL